MEKETPIIYKDFTRKRGYISNFVQKNFDCKPQQYIWLHFKWKFIWFRELLQHWFTITSNVSSQTFYRSRRLWTCYNTRKPQANGYKFPIIFSIGVLILQYQLETLEVFIDIFQISDRIGCLIYFNCSDVRFHISCLIIASCFTLRSWLYLYLYII